MTQTDSRISENTHRSYVCQSCIATAGSEHYLHEGVVSKNPLVEDEVPDWGNNNGACEAVETKLPSLLPLACACIHTRHEENDVEGRECVEDLAAVSVSHVHVDKHAHFERKVPCVPAIRGRRGCEYVEIARAENKSVQSLCDEGDTC
jgi:hypothetical protein